MKDVHKSHTKQESKIHRRSPDSNQPNYALRRVGAAVTALAVLAGGGMFVKRTVEKLKDANVSIEVDDSTIAATRLLREKGVSREEIEEKIGVQILVGGEDGDTLYGIAKNYIRSNEELKELRPNDVVDGVLVPQNNGDDVVSIGEEFILKGFPRD